MNTNSAQPRQDRRSWSDGFAGTALGLDHVGRGTRFSGRPHVTNDGTIAIGADCRLSSHPVVSHVVAMPGARIAIGDRVHISYGAAISALCDISIGDDTCIAPFSMILDNDFHQVGNRDLPGLAAPVVIGRGVHIGPRVTILRGARIGDGARVLAGSTISGAVPAGAVVSGVPARVAAVSSVPKFDPAVAAVVVRTLGIGAVATPRDGPGTLEAWTDAAATRVLLALEETFGVTLDLDALRSMRSIAELSAALAQARSAADTSRQR